MHTGDCGYFDENYCLHILGRKSFMIKSCGHQVHPTEIEEIVKKVPGVTEVCVVGLKSGQNEKLVAVVQKSGKSCVSENNVKEALKDLESYKQLEKVVFVEKLPRSSTGKVQRIFVKKLVEKVLFE